MTSHRNRGLCAGALMPLLLLSACGLGTSSADPSEETAQAGSEEPSAGEEQAEGVPVPPLSEEHMMAALLTSAELPGIPDGHTTHYGVEYFEDEIAVDQGFYVETFGESTCAARMDSINQDLITHGAIDGLLHAYRTSMGEQDTESRLYLWALSYAEPVSTSGIWNDVVSACSEEGLSRGGESIEVRSFSQSPFSGIQITATSENDDGSEITFQGYSATADFGHTIVMVTSANMGEQEFAEVTTLQAEKLESFQQGLAHADST
ncbi:hypothetical protein [Nesterenkonia flava]|uniref:Sensor domain-containing protein n=1 Tax=Nesterenkonia flava TaxID=469799 RepID=A0ABU1FXR9_9MICC|nr:hypothetical protein [Nesterenkonia flava]MDR5712976.1 hypothetical protein [Nesterenkonia flava]